MSSSSYKRWICEACGFIYDEAEGDPDSGLAPGTRYQDIPDDWQCPLCGMKKSDLRLLPESKPAASNVDRTAVSKSRKVSGGDDYVVIIGAGVAGWSVAEAIRRREPERPVLLITACKGVVYPKPAISLAISAGKNADDLVDNDAQSYAVELDIDVQTHTRVLKLDVESKRVTTTKGGIAYNKLILALGAHQRELIIEGDAADSVMRVNDLSSFKKLQQRLSENVKTVTILGAGLIGCEFADDMSTAGYQVTVVDPAERALAGLLPKDMADDLQSRLTGKGVDWKFASTLKRLDKKDDGYKVTLSDGFTFSTDLVLSAAGLVANTALAEKSGLKVDVGIAVDHDMRTSNKDIYAIGDCASVDKKLFAFIEPIRRQANAIAASIAGEQDSFVMTPPMVKIKTQTMPISVCKPDEKTNDKAWQMVSNSESGCYYKIDNNNGLAGFALSDGLASDAFNYYSQIKAGV